MATEEDQWGPSKGLVRTQSVNIDLALANEVFDHFCCQANTLKSILRSFSYLCEVLRVKPTEFQYFYPKIKSKLKSWKAQALWAKFDKRSQHKVYNRGKACAGQRVLVIGAGPCGLRTAIEAQLLGAKVVVIEKRDRFSRNNVLHLWPYNIHDLRGLGAKKFHGKFCAGAIDHISIRQLQCILLKVSLLLGIEVYESVGFEKLIEPNDIETGWRAEVSPVGHPVGQYEFDVLIGADGKRNTLHGFKRKEFRGKLAIAITANFIRKHDEAESHVEEISGVAFIFNQKYFNDLNDAKGIDLENIVYYKDETHYFVMTAKKQSLLEKGVIIKNESDTAKLLAPENIRTEKLFEYAREAADFATNYQLPQLDFAVNHYGKPDVAMFDFTSMFQAENSCRVLERHGHRLLVSLVGDSLLEPFWPTGTGCARGFFGGLDACWLMRQVALGKMTMLEAVAERESIYRVLAQTTPENTSKDYSAYTVDPHSRYPTLNTKLILPFQVTHLVDTDNPSQLEEELRQSNSSSEPRKRRRKESHVSPDTLQKWLATQVEAYDEIVICDMTTSFQNGLALCAIIHRYRPDLVDYNSLDKSDIFGNISLAFDMLEHELGIPPAIPPVELADIRRVPDRLTMMSYLSSIYELFRRDIPAVNRMSVVDEDEDDLLDAQLHRPVNRPAVRRSKPSDSGNRISIGQLVASEAAKKTAKKRRSKESVDTIDDDDENRKTKDTNGSVSNKENLAETARLNRSAHRKRMLRLMERAEASAAEKQAAGKLERKSIKEEERYKVIEAKFGAGCSKRRSGGSSDTTSKYRENKRPKDLKRAIGKLDKEDWNIKNIEEKLLVKKDPEVGQRDKVPKWSKEAFQDKFNIMKGKLENGEEKDKKKYTDVDVSLARLQRKLHERTNLDTGHRGQNRVLALADDLFHSKRPELYDGCQSADLKGDLYQHQSSKMKPTGGSEICHFCGKRVYVVERMSAEGKFFHRSCFRCDYCNVLLRLGSYIYHREGQFAGKFFCVPHSTENSLEKYRYRRKADEIRDTESRQRELLHKATNDWHKDPDKISNFLESLPTAHKERLLSHKDAALRGTTPERAEFEAAVDKASEDETPSIMDEDEWTDRNFGNSLLLDELPNTSEDSVTDLDSDEELTDNERKESHKLLTSKETRQLHKDWLNRWRKNSNDGSQYENVSKGHTSDEEECPHGEEAHEADFEDSESETDHSQSDAGPAKLPALSTAKPHRQRGEHRKKGKAESEEETSSDQDSSDSETSDSESSGSDIDDDSEFSSRSNSECEFTDSEGKPNPFHKELEVPKIVLQPGSPVAGYQRKGDASATNKYHNGSRPYQSEKRPQQESYSKPESQLPTVGYSSRLQYKTPNISGRLQCEESKQTGYVTRSTQRALSLKKNWVSEAPAQVASSKKLNAAEMDNRLKSVMERLSNQQSLLRPADKPSTQMEHLLRNCPTSRITLSQSTSALRDPSRFKSPPPSTVPLSGTSYHFYPLPYHHVNVEATKYSSESVVKPETTMPVGLIDTVGTGLETTSTFLVKDHQDADNFNFPEAESVSIPSRLPEAEGKGEGDSTKKGSKSTTTSSSDSSTESSETSSSESTQSEHLSPVPPPIPPPPIIVPDINVQPCIEDSVNDEEDKFGKSDPNPDSEKEEFASCLNSNNTSHGMSYEGEFQTPNKSLDSEEDDDDGLRSTETIKDDADTVGPPVAASSPLDRIPVKEPVVIKLSNDEVTRIYQERNPLERLAKLNSLKQRESSVVRDMILGRVGAGSRSSSVSGRPLIGARRPRNMVLISSVPPPPLPSEPLTDSSPHILINSGELQQNNFQTKSRSCHQLEQLSDFPLIDADDDDVAPSPPVRPERRNQKASEISKMASQPIQELSSSQQSTPTKKPFSLPATPLTDPEKFGIPVRNTSKHHSKSSTSSRKKLSMGLGSSSKSSDDTPSLASPSDQISSTSNDIDNMDGIVSSEGSSLNTSPAKKGSGIAIGNSSQNREPRKTFMQTITGMFARGTTPDARAKSPEMKPNEPVERKSRSDSFLKFAKGLRSPNTSQKSTPSSPEAPRADLSEISMSSHASYPNSPRKTDESQKNEKNIKEQELLFKTISFQTSHPSTPPVPLTRKITLKNANSEESFSDELDDGEGSPETSMGFVANDIKTIGSTSTVEGVMRKSSLPPEILEKILRKGGKSAKRSAKIAQVKRVRRAQEIQRQLEELDVKHKDLEERGVRAEQNLRGETSNDFNHQSEGELMQTWFLLLAEKNALVRTEQELLVQAKQLELEDRSARLESELREHLLRDSRSPESVSREGDILSELLEISEQREMLQLMLAKDKMRYQIEDKDIEAQMKARGVHITPIRKLANN